MITTVKLDLLPENLQEKVLAKRTFYIYWFGFCWMLTTITGGIEI